MKHTSFIHLLILVFLIIGCKATTPATSPTTTPINTESPPKRIALVMKTLTNPFFVEMERGARRAEEELDIELIVKTAAQETSIEQQINIVDELVQDGIDAIVIAPGDSLELIPVLKKAQDAGIVVVNIDNRLDPDYSNALELVDVPFISVNNEQAAYLSAKYISDQINTPTQVILLEGIRSAQNAEDRKNGALRAFGENDNIEVVMETANWKIDEGYNVTKTLFEGNTNIGAIFAANDMMALGAIQYLRETDQTDRVMVAAFDALVEAKEAIRDGVMDVTIDQQAAEQGYLGVQYAIRMLNGEQLPPETYIEVLVVTEYP